MKRSEMLLNIASTLVDERTEFMRFDKAQEMAEMILSMVEKNGMSPPTIKYLNLKNSELFKDLKVETIPINSWEPEDPNFHECEHPDCKYSRLK